MSIKKILFVFGTRPEAIKMAPLVKEFQNNPEQFETIVCVTAQHREMLDQALQLFEITPDYDLNIMKTAQDLYDVTSRVLIGLRDVLKKSLPDLVLVHGDTSTSTAAALAAFFQQIPVGHIEAGLRTHNIYSPWPEEMNRQITGRIATFHFAPTPLSKRNLLNEGVKEENIYVTGNTVVDALQWVLGKINATSNIEIQILNQLQSLGLQKDSILSWKSNSYSVDGQYETRKMVLITGHRRENFGQGLINICEAIKELSEKHLDVDFVYPIHLNPNVRAAAIQVFGNFRSIHNNSGNTNVFLIEPIDYLPFVYLMGKSYLLLTDSGGIQEEAPSLGKPVLVMRDTTERPEALEAGTVILVGTDKKLIINEVSLLINDVCYYNSISQATNPYGDGNACKYIVSEIKQIFNEYSNNNYRVTLTT